MTYIGDGAFSGSGLISVTIPDSVIYIWNQAFKDCQLQYVHIGKGVSTLGDRAFTGNKLKEVKFTGDPPYSGTYNTFGNISAKLYYPEDTERWTESARTNIDRDAKNWVGYCSHSKTSYVEPTESTCSKAGYKEHWICDHCKKLFLDAEATKQITLSNIALSLKPHTFVAVVDEKYLCNESWNDPDAYWYSCSVCGTKGTTRFRGGTCGEHLTWTFIDGTLRISGTGEMYGTEND